MPSIRSTAMSSRRAIRSAVRAALVLGAVGASACAPGPQFASSVARPTSADVVLLVPGTRTLASSALHDETVGYQVFADSGAGTAERRFGAGRSEIHAVTYAGKPALLLVASTSRGAMHFLDSALVRRDDLTPISEVSEFRGWHRRFEYDGARVRFVATSADSARNGEHTYPHPVFQFNEVDVLVRTIPLLAGYRAIVPLYSEGSDELEMDTISVARPRATGPWDVRFSDPVIVSHYGIDPATRAILSRVITRQDRSPLRLRYELEAAARP